MSRGGYGSISRIKGASMVEFVIAAPVILLLGLGTIQIALIYQGKSTVNYATFEAARAGAVDHAKLETMRDELGLRLAPLLGGDGTIEKAAAAIVASKVLAKDPTRTQIKIINPTPESFVDWGVTSDETDQLVIPNSHLRHKPNDDIGVHSEQNLQDANLLKISVTHGMRMNIPVIAPIMARSMALIDPENSHFYARNQFPLSSVATVRMQSETWQNDAMISSNSTPGGDEDAEFIADSESSVGQHATDVDSLGNNDCFGEHGLPANLPIMQSDASTESQCLVTDLSYGEPTGGDGASGVLGAGCG